MTDEAVPGHAGARMAGGYRPPILAEPRGGPVPGGDDADVKAAAVDADADALQQQWEQARQDLLEQWPAAAQPMVDELADQAQAAAGDDDLSAVTELAVSAAVVTALAGLLAAAATTVAGSAAAGVVTAAAAAGLTITAPAKAGAVRVQRTADAIARLIAGGYASGAARLTLQLAGVDPAEVRDAVAAHLIELGTSSNGLVREHVGALLSAAQHAGRLAVLEQHPAAGYEAVEINDRNRCKPCAQADRHRYPTLAAALADYPTAGNRHCLGGPRCRGFIRPQW